jgi:hypothetical protein
MLVVIDGVEHAVTIVALDFVMFERQAKRAARDDLYEDALWVTWHAAKRCGVTGLAFDDFLAACESAEADPGPLEHGNNGSQPLPPLPASAQTSC